MNIQLIKRPANYRMFLYFENFPHVKAGEYELSIQASKNHYSIPRDNFETIGDYFQVEVGLLKNDKLVQPPIRRFRKHFELGESPVAGYMPVEKVQELYDALCEYVPAPANKRTMHVHKLPDGIEKVPRKYVKRIEAMLKQTGGKSFEITLLYRNKRIRAKACFCMFGKKVRAAYSTNLDA